jgi:putative copper resistance protein D
MHDALIVACWVHVGAVMTLFGSSLFPLYACGGVGLARVDRELPGFTAWSRPLLIATSLLALASALAWLMLEAAEMSDEPADALNPHIIGMVLTETRFGMIWSGHLVLSVALVAVLIFAAPRSRLGIGLGLASLLLASLAGVGHALMAIGLEGAVRLVIHAVHLLAAGAWLGGLVPLAWALKQARVSRASAPAARILRRFSDLALMAMTMLVASGLINSWFLVGRVEALISTPYGQTLLLKLALFAGIVTLAAVNRLVLMPHRILDALFRTVIAEQVLGAGVVGVACVLGTLAPTG